MEQSQYANIPQPQPYQQDQQDQQETKPKALIFVKIIGGLILIQGILSLFLFSLMFFISIFAIAVTGKLEILFLWVTPVLIQGAGLIVVSFGIRNMRLWALYSFTLLLILAIGFSIFYFLIMGTKDPTGFTNIGLGIDVLALTYLWSIFKKFK